jgi:hypothetical protein
MAEMGNGYGSECHLLRYLGRHRNCLDQRVLEAVGGSAISWLDFGFDRSKKRWPDAEWKGMDFLPADEPAKAAWRAFWPWSGNVPNWDAVGRITTKRREEWLLVEAKAHVAETHSSCGAKAAGGLDQIIRAFGETKRALGVSPDRDWLTGHYQYCNRITSLHFLVAHSVPARLLFIYFTGDESDPPTRVCPQNDHEWLDTLKRQADHVGLPRNHLLADRIHTLFLPVAI